MDYLTTNERPLGWGGQDASGNLGRSPQAVLSVLRQGAEDEHTLRRQLAIRLNDLIQARGLTQTAASIIFGIPQPHISELRHYKLSRFSSERLLRFITLLDRDVEIIICPKSGNQEEGTVSVRVAV
jgi:predicted XRE-type DNA-binding protein